MLIDGRRREGGVGCGWWWEDPRDLGCWVRGGGGGGGRGARGEGGWGGGASLSRSPSR